ncbi:hypothetical protein [Agrobacterium arsenijevicii]|uniref:Uncharacterized protein n=1 Tax=Agrobacterium arsenijevicii TaxID=1585697 RepID=A0ABR5CZJ3_9HYPH|nr:hypothetical protein RP75_27505 [Agrobacterium arsenijevicii]
MKYLLALIASLAFAGLAAKSVEASEWGCEVLLCAASSNPSWRGVESCHPPMERLISAMKKPGFSWPTCPEGGAGAPGYERYAECSAGWTPTAGDDQRSNLARDQSRCMRAINQCRGGKRFFRSLDGGQRQTTADGVTRVFSGTNSCSYTEYKARPLRSDPYYFDIKDGAVAQSSRFWFNLER